MLVQDSLPEVVAVSAPTGTAKLADLADSSAKMKCLKAA